MALQRLVIQTFEQRAAEVFQGDPLQEMENLAGRKEEAWAIYREIRDQVPAILDMVRNVAPALEAAAVEVESESAEAEKIQELTDRSGHVLTLGDKLADLTGEMEMVGNLVVYEWTRKLFLDITHSSDLLREVALNAR